MLTVGNAIMYNFIKALSKKPLTGTFPFSEYILGCFQSDGLKTLQAESPSPGRFLSGLGQ